MSDINTINLNGTSYNLGGSGLTEGIKQALLQLAQKMAYIDEDGQDYYDALYAALYPVEVSSISAVYTQSGTVFTTDSLDSLKPDLVVTATYSDSTSETVTAYTLSGSLTAGTSTITVSYAGKTTTFTVTVTGVGSTNYADSLSNFVYATIPTASYSDGKITMKTSQANANAYNMWTFDRAKTMWDDVNGKTLLIRATLNSPDWVGDISTTSPLNNVVIGVAIYKNATITSGADRQKSKDLERVVLTEQSQTFEYEFTADIANFGYGSGTPTSSSTFGVYIYDCSPNTVVLTDVEVREVLS